MPKIADKYLAVDPWKVVEEGFGFDAGRNRVSESIFSLGNEYMGVRGIRKKGTAGIHYWGVTLTGCSKKAKWNKAKGRLWSS
ncbi:hypothetical protein [Paenibacillus woosongensis]|uniref:Glycoside hydrolase family 65 N-terminal domain-containing protein n=1 Tax=Paenibacillus woosongensis TaxID=307580 RepID=A0A7X2YZ36_9BACL|nr:hypothetical protein [Paenibacillus woosongensis]MUG44597.1 hypothetical protein [Paenibacillus woosongensis]